MFLLIDKGQEQSQRGIHLHHRHHLATVNQQYPQSFEIFSNQTLSDDVTENALSLLVERYSDSCTISTVIFE